MQHATTWEMTGRLDRVRRMAMMQPTLCPPHCQAAFLFPLDAPFRAIHQARLRPMLHEHRLAPGESDGRRADVFWNWVISLLQGKVARTFTFNSLSVVVQAH